MHITQSLSHNLLLVCFQPVPSLCTGVKSGSPLRAVPLERKGSMGATFARLLGVYPGGVGDNICCSHLGGSSTLWGMQSPYQSSHSSSDVW